MIDFPASPTVGQQYTAAGVTWTWDGAKWTSGVSAPTVQAMNDNRLVNGDMRIDQRNNGASGTATGYTVDRWAFNESQATKITWGRNLNAVAGPIGFQYYLGFQSSSAYASVAADYFLIQQAIEADMIGDFAFGGASAQAITLSFWARSSLIGTFSGSFQNYGGARSYPFIYSLPTANTWTKIVITISGDTGGTWVASGNGGGAALLFDLGCGSNFRAVAGAWGNGNMVGATGAVSVVSTNGATFYVTGVKLEIGSTATSYNRQSLAKSMADCQRYYAVTAVYGLLTSASAGSYISSTGVWPVTMRVAPTTVTSTPSDANVSAFTIDNITQNVFRAQGTTPAAGFASFTRGVTASAEL